MLLHGVGESAAGWRPVQDALSRHYDVIALDFPGFGGSAKLPADALPSAAALADAAEREMDQLGIGDFHVPGYSLGARVSLDLSTWSLVDEPFRGTLRVGFQRVPSHGECMSAHAALSSSIT